MTAALPTGSTTMGHRQRGQRPLSSGGSKGSSCPDGGGVEALTAAPPDLAPNRTDLLGGLNCPRGSNGTRPDRIRPVWKVDENAGKVLALRSSRTLLRGLPA